MYKDILRGWLIDFSAEILQVRREWHNIFKVLKEKNFQPRILYLENSQQNTSKRNPTAH